MWGLNLRPKGPSHPKFFSVKVVNNANFAFEEVLGWNSAWADCFCLFINSPAKRVPDFLFFYSVKKYAKLALLTTFTEKN